MLSARIGSSVNSGIIRTMIGREQTFYPASVRRIDVLLITSLISSKAQPTGMHGSPLVPIHTSGNIRERRFSPRGSISYPTYREIEGRQ